MPLLPDSYRAVLTHPVAGRLTAAASVSSIGDFVALGALLVVATERSGGLATAAAGLFAVQAVPALVTGTVASGWLARLDPRRWLIGSALLGAAALVFLLAVPTLWAVYAATAVLGLSRSIAQPMASKALAAQVPSQLRPTTIAALGTSFQAAQVVGLLTGGLAAAFGGTTGALVFDLATFLLAAVLYRRLVPQPAAEATAPRRSPLDGVRVALSHPVTRTLIPLAWVALLLGALPEWMLPSMLEPELIGPVIAVSPAASAVASFWAGRNPESATPATALRVAATVPPALVVFTLAVLLGAQPAALVLGNVLLGAAMAWMVLAQGAIARSVAPSDIAHINATMAAAVIALEGLGSLIGGALTDAFGPGAWLVPLTVLVTAATLEARRHLPDSEQFAALVAARDALDDPGPAQTPDAGPAAAATGAA